MRFAEGIVDGSIKRASRDQSTELGDRLSETEFF